VALATFYKPKMTGRPQPKMRSSCCGSSVDVAGVAADEKVLDHVIDGWPW
jgi:hypothetical protein